MTKKPPARGARDTNALPIKEQLFVAAYLAHGNATEAAKGAGYSAKTAYAKGCELLKRPRVAKAIEQAKTRIVKKFHVTAERTIEEMAAIGFSDVRHYQITKDGHVALAPGAPDSAMRAVKRVKRKMRVREIYVPDGTPGAQGEAADPAKTRVERIVEMDTEFELWSKDSQLRNLGDHLKLFKENRSRDEDRDLDDELTPEQRNERIIALLRVALKRKQEATGGKKNAG